MKHFIKHGIFINLKILKQIGFKKINSRGKNSRLYHAYSFTLQDVEISWQFDKLFSRNCAHNENNRFE